MIYTEDEIYSFVEQEDVKFIRLAFCDLKGHIKNVSIMPSELRRAFEDGISFDGSAIRGFAGEEKSDLLLFPIASTLNVLSWRPSHGKVVRMFCEIRRSDGSPFPYDSRAILKNIVKETEKRGVHVFFGSEFEFYLFKTDEDGYPTSVPFDRGGYMDVAPEDKGENIRREICLTLIDMGIRPESSHHEEGPGQNEIDFRYSDPITAADNSQNFVTVVKAAAMHNGLFADFSPKPLPGEAGNGMHVNISVRCDDNTDRTPQFMAGIMAHIREITLFLNNTTGSYRRLGEMKAPKYVTWSAENRSQLIRIPAASGDFRRFELRSPDPLANPYLAFAMIIAAGMDGIDRDMKCPDPVDMNLFTADESVTSGLARLPETLEEAYECAAESELVKRVLPGKLSKTLA